MNIVRNSVAVIVGFIIGSGINIGIVVLGPHVIPPPAGVDVTDTESIRASLHLFEAKHFITPFLAHAIGTLAGSFVAFMLAATYQKRIAYAIGVLFLAGGIAASIIIPAPYWFIALDLIVAYLPMAWLGKSLGQRLKAD